MKKLAVDLDELALALEYHDSGFDLGGYWFDTDTGKVLFVRTDLKEDQALRDQIDDDASRRFVRVGSIDSRDGFRVMEDFVRTLPATRVREKLEWALDGPKPFRRFRDSLDDEKVRKQWFVFHDKALRRYGIAWLADLGIQPEGIDDSESRGIELETVEAVSGGRDDAAEESFEEGEIDGEEADFPDLLDELFSEEDEDELAKFVESLPGGQFDYTKLHGLLTASAVGPAVVSVPEILEILSQESKTGQPILKDLADAQKITGLIGRLHSEIVAEIDAEIFEPAVFDREHPSGETFPDSFNWCEGFVLGMNHARPLWKKWYKDSRREFAIFPIEAAANREFRAQENNFEAPEKMVALFEVIKEVVPLIRYFWRLEIALDEIAGTGNPVQAEPKVGRNAPCPCGSGRKFKHCCGATANDK